MAMGGCAPERCTPAFAARVLTHPQCAIVQFAGELDLTADDVARSAIDTAWATGRRMMVVDLRGLAFMAVTGVQALLTAREAAEAQGRRLALLPGPPARRILELCGVLPCFVLLDRIGDLDAGTGLPTPTSIAPVGIRRPGPRPGGGEQAPRRQLAP
jgi:anti-anti-sigma factor